MLERELQLDARIHALIQNVEKIIVGKRNVVELVVAAMLAEGHVLIEDVPGVGKTQLVSALARSCGGEFGRIQMTPDIMPTDITGFTMIDTVTHESQFKKGVAFCNFLLADEINRASPKTQSALLEVMEEGQISMEHTTYQLEKPFMVLATQNPVETYGTYPLPEAQMDRFMLKISIGYPTREEEADILTRNQMSVSPKMLSPVISCQEIVALTQEVNKIHCSETVREYILSIVQATRTTDLLKLGVSPRGSIALHRMAKAYAYVMGREYVVPDDIKTLAPLVLGHRVMLTPKGKSMVGNNQEAIKRLMEYIVVPVM